MEDAVIGLLDVVAEPLNLSPGGIIADIGCGYGADGSYLAKKLKCRVEGMTVSAKQWAHAQQQGSSPDVSVKLADWIEMKPKANAYDGIISLETLCHLAEKSRFFTHIETALKPGARAAVTGLIVTPWAHRWLPGLLGSLCARAKFPSLGTANEWLEWSGAAGLNTIHFDNLTSKVFRTWPSILQRATTRLPLGWARGLLPLAIGKAEWELGLNAMMLQLAYLSGALEYRLLVVEKPLTDEYPPNSEPPSPKGRSRPE